MGRRTFHRLVAGLLLIALWGMARSASAQDLYSIGSNGNISSHNVTHAHSPSDSGHYGITRTLKIDDAVANKLAPDNALYVVPTIGIGTHGSAPAILFEGRF